MTKEEEKDLVKKAKDDAESFGRLYDEYYPRIFGYVLRRTADLEASQDIVSETFIKALKNIQGFQWRDFLGLSAFRKSKTGSFGAWLYRIAANEIVNFYRKKKPVVSLDALGLIADPAVSQDILGEIILAQEEFKKHEDFLAIQKEIRQLPDKYQEALVLKFFEKKQIKEIAEILQKNEGTIKSLIHRGVEKLKLKLIQD